MMVTQAIPALTRIRVAVAAPIARLTLDHPPLNVIDVAMMEELAQTVSELESNPAISALVISGASHTFSAGVDVAAHTPDKISEMLEKFHFVIRALVASKKVTIAAVHGHCLGGGAELAMVCDVVYTTETAQWGFPEIKLGCYPPVAATALSALVGQKHAAELVLTGRTISGTEAASIRLANAAVPEAQLDSKVDACIERLTELSPAALAITKKAVYAWDSMHFDKGLARGEKIYLDELMQTADAQEGIQAFLQKRKPEWKGK